MVGAAITRDSLREEARRLLRELAGPCDSDRFTKTIMRRLQKKLPWTNNRIKDIWRGDPRVTIRAEEVECLRAYLNHEGAGERMGAAEFENLQAQIAYLTKRMDALSAHLDSQNNRPMGNHDGDAVRAS
jgi:hypothetical protein